MINLNVKKLKEFYDSGALFNDLSSFSIFKTEYYEILSLPTWRGSLLMVSNFRYAHNEYDYLAHAYELVCYVQALSSKVYINQKKFKQLDWFSHHANKNCIDFVHVSMRQLNCITTVISDRAFSSIFEPITNSREKFQIINKFKEAYDQTRSITQST